MRFRENYGEGREQVGFGRLSRFVDQEIVEVGRREGRRLIGHESRREMRLERCEVRVGQAGREEDRTVEDGRADDSLREQRRDVWDPKCLPFDMAEREKFAADFVERSRRMIQPQQLRRHQ